MIFFPLNSVVKKRVKNGVACLEVTWRGNEAEKPPTEGETVKKLVE